MQDLVILGFTQYKDKILNDGKRIDKDKTMDVSDIYEMILPKVKFLSYEIEKSDESGYLIAAKKWIKQMALDHNLKNNFMFLLSGDDVYLVLAHKIAEIADTCLVGADKTMLLQGDPTDFVISDGIRISFWINETE